MILRDAKTKLVQLAKEYSVVSVTGPRQSGKTTLVKSLFPNHRYVNFENLSELELIKSDPLSFISNVGQGVIIDEIQKYAEILSYIQVSVDENYHSGKFILTGSQNLVLGEKVSQSLAGRVGVLQLLPLSLSELEKSGNTLETYQNQIFKGFYPGLYDHERSVNIYYQNYFSTYVQRDVRSIKNLGDLSTFTRLVKLLAGRIGQILNLSELGSQIGVNYKTIESWISILEASYIVYRLEPFYNNFNKRIIKSPKIYFYDTGLAANLLRIDSVKELENHYALGNLYENMVVTDLLKQKYNSLSTAGLYYFRDSSGLEVDVIIDQGANLIPVEIKSSQTFNSDFLKNLNKFREFSGTSESVLIYSGVGNQISQNTKLVNYIKTGEVLN